MKIVVGVLNVYRESSMRETLSAALKVGNETLYWYRAPKCFVDVPNISSQNVRIQCVLNDNNQNPRHVVVI